jgi:hypothetical protein
LKLKLFILEIKIVKPNYSSENSYWIVLCKLIPIHENHNDVNLELNLKKILIINDKIIYRKLSVNKGWARINLWEKHVKRNF